MKPQGALPGADAADLRFPTSIRAATDSSFSCSCVLLWCSCRCASVVGTKCFVFFFHLFLICWRKFSFFVTCSLHSSICAAAGTKHVPRAF